MSKAEDLAKQYRDFREQCGIKDPVMLDEIDEAYYEGYQQAEKDFELSWKDVEKICLIAKESHKFYGFWSESVYQEILKRFNKRKEK